MLSEKHLDTLININNLTFIFKKSDKDERVIALIKKCIKGREEILDSNYSFTKKSKNTLN